VNAPSSPLLSASQLATLAEHGEERTASVGDVLFRVGDQSYPLIAILEGEVAILDAADNEIVRHGESKFLGEMNLLTGQTVFLTAVVTEPLRYIAVDRNALRPLLFDDGPLSDLLLSTFMARREALQRVEGIGLEIDGPQSSAATMRGDDPRRRGDAGGDRLDQRDGLLRRSQRPASGYPARGYAPRAPVWARASSSGSFPAPLDRINGRRQCSQLGRTASSRLTVLSRLRPEGRRAPRPRPALSRMALSNIYSEIRAASYALDAHEWHPPAVGA
jgi:Cyclic nucleotide-binding domain